jgi:hypothetical protein
MAFTSGKSQTWQYFEKGPTLFKKKAFWTKSPKKSLIFPTFDAFFRFLIQKKF